mmetsp:Transcript_46482/g.140823  ORF Transcript_46482/g.140823 Transcript_46482/m.140823 type:complete len:99 (+) Transcript_46482:1775-2071(+)
MERSLEFAQPQLKPAAAASPVEPLLAYRTIHAPLTTTEPRCTTERSGKDDGRRQARRTAGAPTIPFLACTPDISHHRPLCLTWSSLHRRSQHVQWQNR